MPSPQDAAARYRALFPSARLVLISNREPYVSRRPPAGELTHARAAGGLTVALDPVMRVLGGTWIAWGSPPPGERRHRPSDWIERLGVPPEDPRYELRRLALSERDVRNYYYGYANQGLWPLCHNLLEHVRFRDRFWRAYQAVNEAFARAALQEPVEDSLIWLQDYHLALAPAGIRGARPDARLLQFWHVPWPAYEVFRICPNHRSLLEGLLANDLIAFHLESFRDNFIRCCERDLDVVVDWKKHVVVHRGHVTAVAALPISIDAESFRQLASVEGVEDRMRELRLRFGLETCALGIGVDRLDYSKGILERFEALRLLFARHPEHVGRLTFLQVGSPSRSEIPAYADLQEEVRTAVERLNAQWGREDWKPVVYIPRGLPREDLAVLYRMADVAIVSSLQDGMNLVAKEFVAAQVDRRGVLCLSELAGAAEELEHAISVNPFYTEGFAEDIHRALIMDAIEKRHRMERMQAILAKNDVYAWIESVFGAMREALDLAGRRRGGRRLTRSRRDPGGRSPAPAVPPSALSSRAMAGSPATAGVKRLADHAGRIAEAILSGTPGVLGLDYDGTLAEIVADPDDARIPASRRDVLRRLAGSPGIRMIVLSGRGRADVEERLGVTGVTVIGNHGLEIEGWSLPGAGRFRAALASFLATLRGSAAALPFRIEDKGPTATLHLVGDRTDAARDRLLQELQVRLAAFQAGLPARTRLVERPARPPLEERRGLEEQPARLALHPGKASVEVRPEAGWNKASALQRLIAAWGATPEHVFYAGDDLTDECVFEALAEGWTVRVGEGPTAARYRAGDPAEIHDFLCGLLDSSERRHVT